MLIKGSFATPLVRLFDNEAYATQLAYEGRARLTRIDLFRDMEAPRGDPSEGIGRLAPQEVPFVKAGGASVHASVEVVTQAPVYILCFHDANADLSHFAGSRKYGVRIEDPAILNSALPEMSVLSLPSDRRVVSGRVGQVQYDKDGQRPIPDIGTTFPLAFMQKEPRFASDNEWRLAVLLSGQTSGSPEYLDVRIPFHSPLILFRL